MSKIFKCLICDNFTTRRYLGQFVHQTCFDHIVPIVVKKFDIHNHVEVMDILLKMRCLQEGFLNVELSAVLINIINQKIEIVREP